jgi:predicted ester cyclase
VGVDENKALVLRFYEEVWALGNLEVAHEVFADEYVRHDPRPSEPSPGPAGQAQIAGHFRSAFPDIEWHVDLLLGEGDLVAARWTAAGTHSGAWGEVAPTGRKVSFSGVNVFRFGSAGKVVEIWNHRDDLGLMEQVGASVFASAVSPGPREPASNA